jgi:hypothetical protein
LHPAKRLDAGIPPHRVNLLTGRLLARKHCADRAAISVIR